MSNRLVAVTGALSAGTWLCGLPLIRLCNDLARQHPSWASNRGPYPDPVVTGLWLLLSIMSTVALLLAIREARR